jgi:DNA-binding IclR family transcriptional regulator
MKLKVVNSQIDHCVGLVEFMAAEARSLRLSDIADGLGTPRSGVHRLLTALCGVGWVEQESDTGFYRLSLKLATLGLRFLAGTHVLDLCQPVIDRTAAEAGELVRLAIVENDELVTIAHAQGAKGSLVCQSRVFPTLPLHVTASGKAWLATLPNERALELILKGGFGGRYAYGPNAIRNVEDMLRELARTRERGYGLAVEEAEPGVTAVAVAIRPGGASARAAIAITGPAVRMSDARIAEFAKIAQARADELAALWPLRSWPHASGMPHPRAVA